MASGRLTRSAAHNIAAAAARVWIAARQLCCSCLAHEYQFTATPGALRYTLNLRLIVLVTVVSAACNAAAVTGAVGQYNPFAAIANAVQDAANAVTGAVNNTRSAVGNVVLTVNNTRNAAGNLTSGVGAVITGARNATADQLAGVFGTVNNFTGGAVNASRAARTNVSSTLAGVVNSTRLAQQAHVPERGR